MPATEIVDEVWTNGVKIPCISDVSIAAVDEHGNKVEDPTEFFVDPKDRKNGILHNGRFHMGSNMFVNGGRQVLANLIGGKDFPTNNWVINQFSIGSYDAAPQLTDVTLSPQPIISPPTAGGGNTIPINPDGYPTAYFKPLASVDWPAPYFVRFELIVAAPEANGFVVREAALWSGNQTMVCRKTFPGILKTSNRGYSFLWVLRFALLFSLTILSLMSTSYSA